MRFSGKKISPFILSVAAVIVATVVILLITFSCSANTITFKSAFYFICYKTQDNAVSASSISGVVSSYGGAGYILEYNGDYLVTVACYYDSPSAERVCETLKRRDLDCRVVEITTDEYKVANADGADNKLFVGNLTTLQSLSTLAYDCANALDTGEYGQTQAKGIIEDIKSALKGLLNANPENCFSGHIRKLIAECTDAGEGYVYSKDMRRVQIAIADTIINVKMN